MDAKPNVRRYTQFPHLGDHTCGKCVKDEPDFRVCPKCGENLVWPPMAAPLEHDDYIEEVAG